ncbi:MAG: isochorismatase family protein [Bacteroidales bacterium]|nr:isochorismatase family protein [Bacteroidales bacterium]
MSSKNALLIIDAQYDFCSPQGALYVSGAEADMKRLSDWVLKNKLQLDHIILSIDSHQVNDISHPAFWEDTLGNKPMPFTAISAEDIKQDKWKPRFFINEAVAYIETLEKQGEFSHFIWPYHCLQGTRGAAIDDALLPAIIEWTLQGRNYQVVEKGTYPLSEHFGIFRANVPSAQKHETQLNEALIETLRGFDTIYLAGEAKSHCVANSLKQIMEVAPEVAKKFVVLQDCMSDVTGLGHLGAPIYEQAKAMGIKFVDSGDFDL